MENRFTDLKGIRVVHDLPPVLEDFIHNAGREGMNILLVHSYGSTDELCRIYGVRKGDYPVVGYMASRKPDGAPECGATTRRFPELLSEMDAKYNLRMPRFSGGSGADEQGLMRLWAEGATALGKPANFFSMQKLLEREEIPFTDGVAICLQQDEGYIRIGYRTDGLGSLGELTWALVGGSGTDFEIDHMIVNMSVDPTFSKHMFLYEPLCHSARTGKTYRFYDMLGKRIERWVDQNTMSPDALECVMNHCIHYQPGSRTSSEEQARDMLSLSLLAREYVFETGQNPYLEPLSPEARKDIVRPLSKGSRITSVMSKEWGESAWLTTMLGKLSALKPNKVLRSRPLVGCELK